MKISSKIFLLVAMLLTILTIVGVVSGHLQNRIGGELKGVVNRDIVLMETATSITRLQLQKAIIFERVRRIAEELAYQNPPPARKEHLIFYTKLDKSSFDELAKNGALEIVNNKLLIDESLRTTKDKNAQEGLKSLAAVFKEIEKAHIHYDSLTDDIFNMIVSGKYEISQDDLSQIHRDETKLTSALQNLIATVQNFTQQSLAKARNYEETARRILWATVIISLLLGIALAVSIIHSITEPLKNLVFASNKIGGGDLTVRLNEKSKDEFGELSRAFNEMSGQLKESKEKLEEQLNLTGQQKKDLEVVNRELDRFVHTVSHDIRSPLMSISWYADHLRRGYAEKIDKKGQESLEGIARGVERANSLIKDLLTLTRISRVRNPYTFVQIGALIDEVVANLEYKIKQNKVDLEIGPNMPSIICDGIKLKEVFLNLLTNAIKFSSGNDSVQPKISISYLEQPDCHEFTVKDNGIGIAPEHHNEIFAIFKRLDAAKDYEGTGAGLSIVKSVIDDHGGKVWVESDVGKGSEFHFTIPKGLEIHRVVIGAEA
ncbi:MAG: HAMP domain-containing protein [Candidatus Omnitrophica bacterium]|nr:HAMP domain-containing protein [Candidatus Omnitrophota bacterium]